MRGITVLLVDDEIPFVETVNRRLAKRGINILTAFSGEEALVQLDNNPGIQVVVLDVKMPGMNGIETLAEIKRHHPLVEVIILTGHTTIESAIRGMRLGAFDYLSKPCELEELANKIRLAVRKGGHNNEEHSSLARR
ncbi:MAG: response regulator [Deltaproteobacteria bacterium]|nr:response regulator [Deltaproteobacteria bacterium]